MLRTSLIAAATLWAGAAAATTVTETPDAGRDMATAFVLPGGTTTVEGTIENTSISDVDLYAFSLASPTRLTIQMIFPRPGDANLLLFNGLGQGLAGDDDDTSGCDSPPAFSLDACLSLDLAAGDYFLGVGDNNVLAFESAASAAIGLGGDFFGNDDGILPGPTTETLGVIGALFGDSQINDEGPYRIEFSSPVSGPAAVIPLPAGAWLLLSAMGAIGLRSRFGRRA